MKQRRAVLLACLLFLHVWRLHGQLSKPIVRNDQVDVKSNKYLQRINEDDVHNTER